LKKKIALILILIFAVLQIIPREKNENKAPTDADLFAVEEASSELQILIKGACYDCHSYQSEYPWYSNIAPFSWWIDDHIEEGREHLNFSDWSKYKAEKKSHKAEEAVEEIKEGEMPLESYQLAHSSARLSDEETALILNWFSRIHLKYH
tara:strand:- start:178 stop:627 length:450 start_codon:yes stop_codon:yes gene_type:complete